MPLEAVRALRLVSEQYFKLALTRDARLLLYVHRGVTARCLLEWQPQGRDLGDEERRKKWIQKRVALQATPYQEMYAELLKGNLLPTPPQYTSYILIRLPAY